MILSVLLFSASIHSCLLKHELAHAGGWGADHPGAIYLKECANIPMPPHPFPLRGRKPIIHYVPRNDIVFHCGLNASACSEIGPARPNVWLPVDPNGNPVRRK